MNLTELVSKYKSDLLDLNRLSAYKLASGVISKTPVDSGSAKGSWNASLNTPEVKNINTSIGESSNNNHLDVSENLNIGDTFYLTNGQPYIRWLEYMKRVQNGKTIYNRGQEGHMISRTKAEWQQIINDAIREIK